MQLSISIVTTSYNTPLWVFRRHLVSVANQHYSKSQIEHIVMDAGSTNGSVEIARRFGCTVIDRPDLFNKGLVRMSLGISMAKGDIILILEPDNIMIGSRWLQEMVKPFEEQSKVIAAFSMYNGFEKNMPMLTRYCALIGANDPTLLYLDKSEKMPFYKKHYDLGEILENQPGYYIVRFTKDNLPTLGDNGHMVRRSIIQKVNKDANSFLHIQAFAELLYKGFDTYAVVKNSIIHYNGSDVLGLVNRKIAYKKSYFDVNRGKRSYYIFDYHSWKDKVRLSFYVFFSLTFIQPFVISIRGYFSVRDISWFLHPLICFLMVIGYSMSEITRFIKYKMLHSLR